MTDDEIQKHLDAVFRQSPVRPVKLALGRSKSGFLEHYGSEPPAGEGWTSAGPMRWTKKNEDKPKKKSGSLKTKSVLIADHGRFAELALRLARDFGKVTYFTPWASACPRAAPAHVGAGLEGVKKVATFWDHVPDADVVVFPDLHFADWQEAVASRFDKPVWGHGWAEMLELDRKGAHALQKKLDVAAPKTRFFVGVTALSEYLKTSTRRWVKASTYKGDLCTFEHQDWHTTGPLLDAFRCEQGALAEEFDFAAENHVEGVDLRFDGWTVWGEFPQECFWGISQKGLAYLGKFDAYQDVPESLRKVNKAFAPLLEENRASGFLSFETKVGPGGESAVIDPCLRCGSSCLGLMEGYDNLGEMIWAGAHGEVAAARPVARYLAMAMIRREECGWVPVTVPDDLRRWVKFRDPVQVGDALYCAPSESCVAGAVVGLADTIQGAVELVRERAGKVVAHGLEVQTRGLDLVLKEMTRAREFGVAF